MTKKEKTKLINLLFEVYRKGVEGEECNLDDSLKKLLEAINYTRCCTEFADGKCRPMVNADWTYLRCECGKRFEPKAEPLIIEMNKDHLVELYNFAYEQALKTGKVDELKEIDAKLNGC